VCSTQSDGNWGAVDFDGGNNAAGTLANWTLNGYPNPVTIPSPPLLPADPGLSNSSALAAAFTSLVNQVVLLPSVSGYAGGNGNNGTFNAVGILTAKICGVRYGNNNYNIEADGTPSDCWVDPTVGQWVPSQKPILAVGTVTTKGATSTLTLTSAPSGFDFSDPNMQVTSVTIANAGGTTAVPAPLVTTIVSNKSTGMTAQLSTKATTNVTGAQVTIQYNAYTGIAPLLPNGQPIDHIQFRWVNYSTSSYPGNGGPTCTFDNAQCQGATMLWR
jgi:hypothetical protein